MIDLKDLRENPQKYRDGAAAKNYDPNLVDQLLEIDTQLRAAIADRESLTAEQNKVGKEIGQLAPKLKSASNDEKTQIQAQIAELKQKPEKLKPQIKELETQTQSLTAQRNDIHLLIPQPPDTDVPHGQSADDNVQISTWNPDWFDPAKSFEENKGFKPKSHIDLLKNLNLVDFERGVKLAGSRSYVLLGQAMQLHQAILRYAFDFMVNENNFTPVTAPPLVREHILTGTGFFPHGKDDVYHIANPTSEDQLYLTGTGEAGLMGLHMDEIIDEEQLPLTYTTVSTCFRRESGSAGKDTAGLFRIHQFDKVEQVVICKADEEESRQWHQKMLGFVQHLIQSLQLPYRLLQCCTADLGPKNADMIDLECWMPSRGPTDENDQPTGAYAETHSASRLYDYQTRRLNLRYKPAGQKKTIHCHSLNNTVAASPRILIPIIELYQNEDGTINIPTPLQPHMGGATIIK